MELPSDTPLLAARPQEQLLIDLAASLPLGRLLTNTAGRAQFAQAYAAAHDTAEVICWSLDLFQHRLIAADARTALPNLRLHCSADWPEETFDLAAVLVQQRAACGNTQCGLL